MNQSIFLLIFLISSSCHVEAQSNSGQSGPSLAPQTGSNSFQPSLAVVIGILAIMFSITFILLAYAKFCQRVTYVNNNQQNLDGFMRPSSRFSGIDKTVIESLPFFRFSSLRGSRGGLECAVCLSQFEDIEILRLLPKCKHAFHISCVDEWLENHSSCPLCRQKISTDDLATVTYTSSMRQLSTQVEVAEDSNVELFVQREENRLGSSRFSFRRSFKKHEKGVMKEEKLPIREKFDGVEENNRFLHKFNHKIIVSDVVLKRRWSNLTSSDLVSLNSEMLGDASSNRFASLDPNTQQNSVTRAIEDDRITKVSEKMKWKRDLETKVSKSNQNDDSSPFELGGADSSNPSRFLNPSDKRSMSEIAVLSRFRNNSVRESSDPENAAKEERLKKLWLPIARKTVQWYSSRDKNSQESSNNPRQSLNV